MPDHSRSLAFALESCGTPVLRIRHDASFSYVNAAAAKQLGYPRDELLSLTICDIAAEMRPRDWRTLWGRLQKKHKLHFEMQCRHGSGRLIPMQMRASLIEFEDEEFVFALVTDISERKQVEDKRRNAESIQRSILESSLDSVMLLDPQGNRRHAERERLIRQEVVDNSVTPTAFGDDQFHMIHVNQAFRELFGIESDEQILGMPNTLFEAQPTSVAEINAAMIQSGSWTGEVTTRKFDGTPIDVFLHASLIRGEEGSPIGSMVTFWDITDRNRAREQIAYRSRQQAAVAQLGVLALQGMPIADLLDEAVAVTAETLGVEFTKVLELAESETELVLRAGCGWREGLIGQVTVLADANSQAGYTLRCDEPIVVDSLPSESRFKGPELLLEHDIMSGVSVVIRGTKRAYGVLGIHTRKTRKFSQDEVNFVQSVANVLAQAIQRSRQECKLRQARDELKASEIKFRAIVETTQEWIWEVDLDGLITYSNPAIENILGYTFDEVLGKLCFRLMHEDDRKQIQRRFAELIQNAQGWSGWEIRWRHKDGNIRHLESNAAPIQNEHGQLCGFRGADRDVTARVEAEQAIRASERSLAKAQQIAKVGSWQVDLGTGQVSASVELRRIIGASENDFLESDVLSLMKQIIHPDDHKLAEASYENALSHGVVQPLEFRVINQSDHQVYFVRAETELISDSDGTPQRIVGTLQDVTERKEAEHALRESEEKFRILSEESPAIVLIARNERFVYCNAAASAASGYSHDELLQMSLLDIVHPDYRGIVAERHRQRLQGEAPPQRYEFMIVTKDGNHRWLDFSAQLIDFRNAPAVLAICVDVTERKVAEERLRQKESQLAHVSRLSTMGEMVAGIAHEINQPLSAIANFAMASKNAIEGASYAFESPVEDWLREVNEQAVRCGEIIRRLRTFVKKSDDGREWTDLNRVVRESLALLESEIRHKSIDVECRLLQPGTQVYVNSIQLQQVIVNLLRNACDATADTVAPKISIVVERHAGCARLTIEDNGRGVEESQRQKLFDTFFTTKPDGMGMGLAISKSIVEAHGGRLRFDSGTTSGAKFHVELPADGKRSTY